MPRNNEVENVTIEDAKIRFRNFAGNADTYNREGNRTFAVLLPDDVAKDMEDDGWNVKTLKPREEDEEPHPQPYIQVAVSYKIRPPRIIMITSRGRTNLDEDMVEMLDYADIKMIDLTLNPSFYDVNGKTGIKAYLRSMYVTIEEDELDLKYADVQDARNPVE